MNNLEERLLDMGLKVWEKGVVKRIYVKSRHVKELIDFDAECEKNAYLAKNTKDIFARMDRDGAWLDCGTGRLESKKASVQNFFEDSKFSSKFGY